MSNLQRNVWPSGQCLTQCPDAIHLFVNFDVFNRCILVKTSLINTKTWESCESWCSLSDYVDQ